MQLRRLFIVLTSVPLALLTIGAQAPADGPTVAIDSLEAQGAGDGVLDVSGAVSWSGSVTIAEDAEGDAIVPGIGTDYTAGTVTKEMGDPTLTFTTEIADSIPQVYAVGEVIQFNWPVTVGDNEISLQAWRSARNPQPRSTDPVFSVNVCTTNPDTGQGECTATAVDGEFTDGAISWFVPVSILGADPGGTIVGADSVYSSPGATGLVWLTGGAALDSMPHSDLFRVPGQVSLQLTDAAGATVASGTTETERDGSFATGLDTAGAASGDYQLTATTCYGGFDGCTSETTTVTIP